MNLDSQISGKGTPADDFMADTRGDINSPGLTKTTPARLSIEEFERLESVPPEMEWYANLRNPNTRRAYQNDVREFMAFLGIDGMEALRRVGRAHVIAWRVKIEKRDSKDKCVNPATVRRKLSAVSSLFEYLCDRGAVTGNPAAGVSRPTEGLNEGKTPAISDRQARALLDAPRNDTLKGLRDRAILLVFLYHGPRVAEVAALRVMDLYEEKEVLHFRIRGKGDKSRKIPAHPIAIGAIREYLQVAGHGSELESALFRSVRNNWTQRTHPASEGMSPGSVYDVIRGYAEKVGIKEGARPHALRATAATNALEHGADIAKVRYWLGHSHIQTTTLYDKRDKSPASSPTFKVSY